MEYCPNGDLFEIIVKNGPFPARIAKACFLQLVKGLNFIHSVELAHLDMKMENILIDHDFKVKIADFGFVQTTTKPVQRLCGTKGYMPPEILNRPKEGF